MRNNIKYFLHKYTLFIWLIELLNIDHLTDDIMINGELYKIDIPCIPMVLYFNSVGLYTKFSCYKMNKGDFYIQFNESVDDNTILNFIETFPNSIGNFYKWSRYRKEENKIIHNWTYVASDLKIANEDLQYFKN